MPKMKTKSSAKKRFRVRGSGSVKRAMAFKRHILTKKTTKRKRALDMPGLVSKADQKNVAAMIPYK
jgi:large subunit ribosomal protein L35